MHLYYLYNKNGVISLFDLRKKQKMKYKYRNRMAKFSRIIFVFLLLSMFCLPVSVQAENDNHADTGIVENKRVLFLSSYSYTWSTVPQQIEGIQSKLDSSVTLDIEFMDTKKIKLEMAEQIMLKKIRFKQKNAGKYDAVIVGDDAALVFAMQYRKTLFKDVPIVFEGINNIKYAKKVSKDPLVTGVIEQFSYKENLDFAKKIQPDAKKVVAIVDNTVTGVGEQQQFYGQKNNYPELCFEVINGSLLTKQQLVESISEIDRESILIYLILSEDKYGNTYTNEQVCQILDKYAKVPVLRFVQAGIGEGVLGGNIVSHKTSGEIAAEMVMKMLHGVEPASIKMVSKSPNGYYLDQKVIDKFNISESLIPEGAKIVNRKLSFWEKYGVVLIVTLCVCSGITVIILVIMRTIYAHRRYVELEKTNHQLEEAAVAAKAADRAKSVFLHSMSHDIRTPMNAIIGFTKIAIQQNKDKIVEKYLEKIMISSKHLLALISDVLDISHVENGKMEYRPVSADLRLITDEALAIIQGFLSEKNIRFHAECPKEEQYCRVMTDPVRVREVLVNIFSNAVKFTESGGSIDFSMEINQASEKDHVVVRYTISDTGCGISEEFLPHIFEEFTQEEVGARTQYKGTGLGMAITKRYIDMMGGTICVKSRKSEGTTFTVELPLKLSNDNIKVEQKSYDERKNLDGINVLLAEDNDINAEIIAFQLKAKGIKFIRVTNGKQAVETFAKNAPGTFDVILMDIMMPEMDGYEATKNIRNMSGRPDGEKIPIIAMTANAFSEDIKASIDAGMNEHLTKPLDVQELLETIETLLH